MDKQSDHFCAFFFPVLLHISNIIYNNRLVCEFFFPKTFDGLCLIEPVIGSNIDDVEIRAQYPTMSSKNRRDTWANR